MHMVSFSPKWYVHINCFSLWLDSKSVSCRKNLHFCFTVIFQSVLKHLVQQYKFPTLFHSLDTLSQKVLIIQRRDFYAERVSRVDSVFQSKSTITWPARLKKLFVRNSDGRTGTFLGGPTPTPRSGQLWHIPPHSTEAKRMAPVSAAEHSPSLTSHCVWVF